MQIDDEFAELVIRLMTVMNLTELNCFIRIDMFSLILNLNAFKLFMDPIQKSG